MPGMSNSSDDIPGFRASVPGCPYRSQIATPTGSASLQTPAFPGLHLHTATLGRPANRAFVESRLDSTNSERGPPVSR
jgi:hypothetical protein